MAAAWFRTLRTAVDDAREDRIAHTAAGVAYYWFLAIFPLLIALIGFVDLLGLGPSTLFRISDAIRGVLPGGAAELVVGAVRRASRQGGDGIVGPLIAIAVATWSGTRGMIATQVGLNIAYDLPSDRSSIRQRLLAIGLLAATAVVGVLALVAALLGGPLRGLLAGLPAPLGWVDAAWTALAWVLGLAATGILFTVLYAFGPNRRPPVWRWFSPGVVVGTLAWGASAFGVAVYLRRFGRSYAKTYGPLADVVVLLLWLYLSALALLFGAELNARSEGRVSGSTSEGRRRP